MFTGQVASGVKRDRDLKMGGKGSELSYVPTSKKLSSPRYNTGYLKEHNSSDKKNQFKNSTTSLKSLKK